MGTNGRSEPVNPTLDTYDCVLNHIFGASTTLAEILGLCRVDHAVGPEVDRRVRDALDVLYAAVAELRAADHDHPDPVTHTEIAADMSRGRRRRLCHFAADEVFAYAVNSYDFYRAADHTLWAHESEGLLLSARSGAPLARRDGKVFYDVESSTPLYYEYAHPAPG
jgi:hypothetical protein